MKLTGKQMMQIATAAAIGAIAVELLERFVFPKVFARPSRWS